MQGNRLTHQCVIFSKKVIDLFDARFAGNQVFHFFAERSGQGTANEDLALAGLVHDFISAKAQGLTAVVCPEFHHAVLLAVVDQVHVALLYFGMIVGDPLPVMQKWGQPDRFQADSVNSILHYGTTVYR